MQSKATTVEAYLSSLPDDRRRAIEEVRRVILKNLDKDFEEGMQYGMIGYYVPHRVFPPGYHCDPRQALPFAGLASQKGYMSLYLMCVYGDSAQKDWFVSAWKKTGKKLDMGKACIRFKQLQDIPLEVIGEAIRRVPAKKYIEKYVATLESMGRKPASRASSEKSSTAKKAAKSPRTTKSQKPKK